MNLPKTWRVYVTEDRDAKAARLKQHFAAVSRKAFGKGWWRRVCIELSAAIMLGIVIAAAWTMLDTDGTWTFDESVRHQLARPNCDAARSVGLAPARRGSPGYWPSHDADGDGWACEPWNGNRRRLFR